MNSSTPNEPSAAPDPRSDRRAFLSQSHRRALQAALAVATPAWLSSSATAQSRSGRPDTLVQIFLRGAMDGLTTCVPYGDSQLYAAHARPNFAPRPPGSGSGFDALDLDGFFGLAPAAAPLLRPYQDGNLAIVHAVGSTNPTRSHFDAMKFMEYGIPDQPQAKSDSGWIGRHLETTTSRGNSPLRAMALQSILPHSLLGAPETLPVADPANFPFPGAEQSRSRRRSVLQAMYQEAPSPLDDAAENALETIDHMAGFDFNQSPRHGAQYPSSELGEKLRKLAILIRSDPALECLTVDAGGWDTHSDQGPQDGMMAGLLADLTGSLEALYLDLTSELQRVTVVVLSEFGRRVVANASLGTDHGHGNCMLVMGGNVDGGQVLSQWPGLAPGQLDDGDLAVTTDYRDVLAEILEKRLGNVDLDHVFPGHTPTFPGVIR